MTFKTDIVALLRSEKWPNAGDQILELAKQNTGLAPLKLSLTELREILLDTNATSPKGFVSSWYKYPNIDEVLKNLDICLGDQGLSLKDALFNFESNKFDFESNKKSIFLDVLDHAKRPETLVASVFLGLRVNPAKILDTDGNNLAHALPLIFADRPADLLRCGNEMRSAVHYHNMPERNPFAALNSAGDAPLDLWIHAYATHRNEPALENLVVNLIVQDRAVCTNPKTLDFVYGISSRGGLGNQIQNNNEGAPPAVKEKFKERSRFTL